MPDKKYKPNLDEAVAVPYTPFKPSRCPTCHRLLSEKHDGFWVHDKDRIRCECGQHLKWPWTVPGEEPPVRRARPATDMRTINARKKRTK